MRLRTERRRRVEVSRDIRERVIGGRWRGTERRVRSVSVRPGVGIRSGVVVGSGEVVWSGEVVGSGVGPEPAHVIYHHLREWGFKTEVRSDHSSCGHGWVFKLRIGIES